MLALQSLQQGKALLDLLETCRRGLDAVRVASEKARQVLELRLDAVARLEVRLELRLERRQLRDTPPHPTQRAKDCVVVLVEGRVALRAQPLDAFGAGEDLPEGRQVDVFARILERGAIELAKLERDQIDSCVAIAGRGS